MPDRRELYRSPNGDTWFLGREPTSGHAFIIHQPNAPSGGLLSHIELGEFLRIVALDRNTRGGATLCLFCGNRRSLAGILRASCAVLVYVTSSAGNGSQTGH
jgi:hypothetical protein